MWYNVKAIVDDVEIIDKVNACDPHDAVDVFEICNDCYNNGKHVRIKNVEATDEQGC